MKNLHVHDFAFLNNVRNTVTVYDYHNVAAMILLHTGSVEELNFQVSFFSELSAEISSASSCL